MLLEEKKQYERELRDEQTDWLKVCHDSSEVMRDAGHALHAIASRLAYVSPQSPAVLSLAEIAVDLHRQADKLFDATGKKVSEDLRASEQHSGNMLRASLAGLFTAGHLSQEEREALMPLIKHAEETGSPINPPRYGNE
ncbi:MAG: hypothetical protein ACREGR_01225 [Minisyncoccia bacterium]